MAGHPHHRVGRPRPHPSIPVTAANVPPFAAGLKNLPPAFFQIPIASGLSEPIGAQIGNLLVEALPMVAAPSPAPPSFAGTATWPSAVQSQISAGALLSSGIQAHPRNGLGEAHLFMCPSAISHRTTADHRAGQPPASAPGHLRPPSASSPGHLRPPSASVPGHFGHHRPPCRATYVHHRASFVGVRLLSLPLLTARTVG